MQCAALFHLTGGNGMKHTIIAAALLSTLALNPATAGTVAEDVSVSMQGRSIVLEAPEASAGYQLLVRDPDGGVSEHAFHGGDALLLSGHGRDGAWLDGNYDFEIRAIDSARMRGAHDAQPSGSGDAARAWSGGFAVLDGILVDASATEAAVAGGRALARPSSRTGAVVPMDQVISDDLIVQGSTCVGFDCINNETFSFDTLRLKENNLQIHFEDTSTGTFPSNDWRIIANDSTNGGRNYLTIQDATAGTRPFWVMAGAPENALYVGSNGLAGFGTSTPVMALSTLRGDTPGVRLEQAGGGWTPHTWDIGGNEANFFVRDVTSGSRLPLRIFPGAATSTLTLNDRGVAIGVTRASARLHVRDNDADRRAQQLRFESPVRTRLAFADASGVDSWHIDVGTGNAGAVSFIKPGARNMSNLALMRLDVAGNLRLLGTLTQNSDRDTKRPGDAVDVRAVLDGVLALPITRWSFLADSADVTHIGPMAQDFHAAFGLGDSARSIAPLDTSGVALAAIQGLAAELEARDARISELELDVARLAEAVEALSRAAR